MQIIYVSVWAELLYYKPKTEKLKQFNLPTFYIGEFMFCPICRAEYREGFLECTDCDVDLVAELEAEPEMPGFVKLATIFREGNIAVIKASFDKTAIVYFFEGEQSHRLAPVPLGAGLMVREDFRKEAESILMELELL